MCQSSPDLGTCHQPIRIGSRWMPLVTIGPSVGNTAAGSGGLLAVVGALVIKHQMLPARLNAGKVEGLDAGPVAARAAKLRHVLVASSALGGQNAAAVLSAV